MLEWINEDTDVWTNTRREEREKIRPIRHHLSFKMNLHKTHVWAWYQYYPSCMQLKLLVHHFTLLLLHHIHITRTFLYTVHEKPSVRSINKELDEVVERRIKISLLKHYGMFVSCKHEKSPISSSALSIQFQRILLCINVKRNNVIIISSNKKAGASSSPAGFLQWWQYSLYTH